jgi:hypothetical protein
VAVSESLVARMTSAAIQLRTKAMHEDPKPALLSIECAKLFEEAAENIRERGGAFSSTALAARIAGVIARLGDDKTVEQMLRDKEFVRAMTTSRWRHGIRRVLELVCARLAEEAAS